MRNGLQSRQNAVTTRLCTWLILGRANRDSVFESHDRAHIGVLQALYASATAGANVRVVKGQ